VAFAGLLLLLCSCGLRSKPLKELTAQEIKQVHEELDRTEML